MHAHRHGKKPYQTVFIHSVWWLINVYFFYFIELCQQKTTFMLVPLPPDSRERLRCDHIQRVPGRNAQAIVKAQHENHHGLTGAKPQEETAYA